MSPNELCQFYETLTGNLRGRGVVCAITSGLACVHYGIAETTKDCDLLCHPSSAGELLNLLDATRVEEEECRYRGNISPPLEARWHLGGWTSHFRWGRGTNAVHLDVFGQALRETFPWSQEVLGLYAGPRTIAEMKRTNRDKDWTFITALGVRMIEADDPRGWLHIFDADILTELLAANQLSTELANQRPALRLALSGDPKTAGALNAERRFWEELDRRRVQMLEHSLRPYVSAVRRESTGRDLSLLDDHTLRLDCANRHLPPNPLRDYGVERYIREAREKLVTSGLIPEGGLEWLPDVSNYFTWIDA